MPAEEPEAFENEVYEFLNCVRVLAAAVVGQKVKNRLKNGHLGGQATIWIS